MKANKILSDLIITAISDLENTKINHELDITRFDGDMSIAIFVTTDHKYSMTIDSYHMEKDGVLDNYLVDEFGKYWNSFVKALSNNNETEAMKIVKNYDNYVAAVIDPNFSTPEIDV